MHAGRTDDLFCFVTGADDDDDDDMDADGNVQTDEEVAEKIIDEAAPAQGGYAATARAAAAARTARPVADPAAPEAKPTVEEEGEGVSDSSPPAESASTSEAVLDSTARQKLAYANAMGLGGAGDDTATTTTATATMKEEKRTDEEKAPMKPVVEDLGPAPAVPAVAESG